MTDITVSQAAIDKIKSLKDNDNYFLRITLQEGGCAGFQYGFAFDNEISPDDFILESDAGQVVFNKEYLPKLEGSIIDFESSLTGSHFLISNPNAKSTCGCGSSFSC